MTKFYNSRVYEALVQSQIGSRWKACFLPPRYLLIALVMVGGVAQVSAG